MSKQLACFMGYEQNFLNSTIWYAEQMLLDKLFFIHLKVFENVSKYKIINNYINI